MWEVASPLIRYALELAARNVVRIVSERGAIHSRILEGLVVCGRRLSCGTASVVVAAGFMTQ
jgi:hypothetical protein